MTARSQAHPCPIISLAGVSVRYDSSEAWVGEHIDLQIGLGETVLLLGPSGCGKSTLLLALAGLIPASVNANLRGHVLCNGIDTRDAEPGQLADSIGIVFQDPDAQVVTGSLLDEVCFGLENLLVPVEHIERRALAALLGVGLARSRAEAMRSPAELSGGGRQRLAIACALALDPRILVFDEPTANLDPSASEEFYATLAKLKHPSRSIVIVEHELDDAVALADRIVVLDRKGKVIFDGDPEQVFGHHARELSQLGIWLPTTTRVALQLGLDSGGKKRALPVDATCLLESLDAIDLDATGLLRAASGEKKDLSRSKAVIQVKSASVELDKKRVLHAIDVAIHEGEFFAIAGVNGAGKSTLIRAIAGLTPLCSGEIFLGGASLASMDSRQIGDRVGYVFQNPEHQFLAATVREELAYGLRVRHCPTSSVDDAVNSMLVRFDLCRHADSNPFLLSHGEKRRLSVATALITKPSVLIMDEPTFGQDYQRTHEVVHLVREINKQGVTILMVTHDLQLIADHADRVAILVNGSLVRVGATSEVFLDERLLEDAGLRRPPIQRLARKFAKARPEWKGIYSTQQVGEALQ